MREPLTEDDLDRIEALARPIVRLHRQRSWDSNLNVEQLRQAEEILALVEEVRRLRADGQLLRDILRRLEWSAYNLQGDPACPECHTCRAPVGTGHQPHCALHAALHDPDA